MRSIKTPEKLRLLESLFPSHHASPDDTTSTEYKQTIDRHAPSDRQLQPPLQQLATSSNVVVDTNRTDDLSRRRAAKHRNRALLDSQTDDHHGITVERLSEFPRPGKTHRRRHPSSRRQHGKASKHRHTGVEEGRRRQVRPRYGASSESRSASVPIDVAIRLLGSRQRRARHHHSGRRRGHRRARTSTRSIVELNNRRTRRRRSVNRMSRDVDKQHQRLVLEKLLESSMLEAERAARQLTSSRLGQLLGNASHGITRTLLIVGLVRSKYMYAF